jgi:hypothetical protein
MAEVLTLDILAKIDELKSELDYDDELGLFRLDVTHAGNEATYYVGWQRLKDCVVMVRERDVDPEFVPGDWWGSQSFRETTIEQAFAMNGVWMVVLPLDEFLNLASTYLNMRGPNSLN